MRAFLAVLLLAGCSHSAVRLNNAQPTAPVTANATGAIAAALVVTAIAVTASQDPTSQPVPALETERNIAEQDCTQPIDLTAGNLRCR